MSLLLVFGLPKLLQSCVVLFVTQYCLNVGSNLLLANAAITALEAWLPAIPSNVLQPYLPRIMAALAPYLSGGALGDAQDDSPAPGPPQRRDAARPFKHALRPTRKVAGGAVQDTVSADGVRKRLVQLLGSMGGQGSGCLVQVSRLRVQKSSCIGLRVFLVEYLSTSELVFLFASIFNFFRSNWVMVYFFSPPAAHLTLAGLHAPAAACHSTVAVLGIGRSDQI